MKAKRILCGGTCALLLCSSLLCVACKEKREEQAESTAAWSAPEVTEINYDGVDVSKYVSSVIYTGLTVSVDEVYDRESALWDTIYSTAVIEIYPEDKVEYYFNQTKKSYMSSVDYNQGDYALLLEKRGTTEEEMWEEARLLVKQDLVYRYILGAEGITLTEADKNANFDRYADKFAEEFQKPREYVVAEMADYIYEAMLYDKTVEFLILNNNFVTDKK